MQECELGTMKSVGQAGRGAESERLGGEAEEKLSGAATNHKQDEKL